MPSLAGWPQRRSCMRRTYSTVRSSPRYSGSCADRESRNEKPTPRSPATARSPSSGRTCCPERIAENFDVFDFELTTAELKVLDTLDTGVRGGPEPDQITLENLGRPIPEA